MTFPQAIGICFSKYVDFSGRARRTEYWYWVLFTVLLSACMSILDVVIFPRDEWGPLYTVANVATFLPSIAVCARRLHDIDRSGWWQLLWLIPVVGWIVLLVWAVQKSDSGPNRFGDSPLGNPSERIDPVMA